MDSALRLLSEWSMRSWSDVSVMKIKKVSARKSPILLVIPLAAAAPAAYGQATPLGAPTQAGWPRARRRARRTVGYAIRAPSLSPRIGGKLTAREPEAPHLPGHRNPGGGQDDRRAAPRAALRARGPRRGGRASAVHRHRRPLAERRAARRGAPAASAACDERGRGDRELLRSRLHRRRRRRHHRAGAPRHLRTRARCATVLAGGARSPAR